MARQQTGAAERTMQNKRLVGRASKEVGTAVTIAEAKDIIHNRDKFSKHPTLADDPREYIIRGITGYMTQDRVLDFEPEEVRFLGDVMCELSDVKFYRGGTLVINLQTTDEHLETITDAVRLSRAHPLLIRLFELMPKPESPWADGTHPLDEEPATPGLPHSFNRNTDPANTDNEWSTS